jgi:ankyrin repeat protein
VDTLLAAGVRVDGDPALEVETPCQVAIRRGAFVLADHLVARGASLNALSRQAALFVAQQPLTILGHVVALNAHSSSVPSLRYVLAPQRTPTASFVVDPARGWSVLHWCCAVPAGLTYVRSDDQVPHENFDWRTNRFVLEEVLEHFAKPQHLDHRAKDGRTALHVAVEYAHIVAIELLVQAGANQELYCDNEETPLYVAKRLHNGDTLQQRIVALASKPVVR